MAILAFSAVLSFIFCVLYVLGTLQLRSLQGQVNIISNSKTAVSGLVTEALEYSKHNPGIDPLLEKAGIKQPKTAPASTNKPASK